MKLPEPSSAPIVREVEPQGPTVFERFRDLSPGMDALEGRRAGLITRSVAYAIDFFCIMGGYVLIVAGYAVFIGLINFRRPTYPDFPQVVDVVTTVTWYLSYFVFSWYLTGRTIGNGIMGLRVVGWRRRRLGFLQSIVRYFAFTLTIFIAPVWLFFARSRLALHDRIARTQVIYERSVKHTAVKLDVGSVSVAAAETEMAGG